MIYNWRFILSVLYFPGNFIRPMDLVKKPSICSIQTSSPLVNGKLFYKLWVTFFSYFEEFSPQSEELCCMALEETALLWGGLRGMRHTV